MRLVINADDYGYARAYDDGIVEAARAGAIDGAGVMVMRRGMDPRSLLETGVAIGLHVEEGVGGLDAQMREFEVLFGRGPDYVDGHHHCHASGPMAVEVAELGRERGIPVRSIDARHRRLLRCKGVVTADRLVGRLSEDQPVLPAEIGARLRGEGTWGRGIELVEWMVHPGHAGGPSSYDAGRKEDLGALLELTQHPELRLLRPLDE